MDETLKCVIVINEKDTAGVTANAIACLSFGLGAAFSHDVVEPIADQDGILHGGIINRPVPILSGNSDTIRDIFLKAQGLESVHVLDMNNRAQEAHTLEEYKALIMKTSTEELDYAGIALYGPKQDINKLTGSLKLFR